MYVFFLRKCKAEAMSTYTVVTLYGNPTAEMSHEQHPANASVALYGNLTTAMSHDATPPHCNQADTIPA